MKPQLIAILSSLLLLPSPALLSLPVADIPQIAQLSPDSLRQTAKAITVKVLVKDTQGSGFIIAKQGNTYIVVTNAHVVSRGTPYRIVTPDGKEYQATLTNQGDSFKGNDLAVLQFQSSISYQVAQVENSRQENEEVYAVGFPLESNQLTVIQGKIELISVKPLAGGYQIGFVGETQQGMSGGALLNAKGKVIGVLGLGNGAILNDAYTYNDGRSPSGVTIDRMRKLSFAVPVENLGEVSPQSPQNPKIPNAQYTGIVKQVDDIAQQITVRIDYQENERPVNGSGVIVAKEGKTYYVLTAAHVVNNFNQHQLTTPDGQIYLLSSQQITILNKDIDIALVTFTSEQTYQVAELGNYSRKDRQWIFVSGFPAKDSNKQRQLTAGIVRDRELASFVSKDEFSLSNGQELLYTSLSLPGMSGGAILDDQGRVVGINTGAENEYLTSSGEDVQEVSLGYSLGVPISSFLGLASKGKVPDKSLSVSQTAPKEISSTEQASIMAQLFDLQPPTKDSNALDWLDYGNQLWRSFQGTGAVVAFERAISLLEKTEKKDPLALAYYGKGLAFTAEVKLPEALEAFQQATLHDAGFSQAWRYQGLVLGKMKQYPEALVAYEKAIQHSKKNNFVLYVEMGDTLRELKRYPEALNFYNQAITLKKDHSYAYSNRGKLYYKQQKWDLALSDFNKAIELAPNDAEAYTNRGLLYQEQQKWDLALSDYNQAIQLNSNLAQAYNNRGLLYQEQKKWDLALSDYNQAIQLNSNLAQAYTNRGYLYAQQQKWDLALSDFNQAIQLDSNLALAYTNRGYLYVQQQKWDSALSDYTKAIDIDSNLAQAYTARGILYAQQQKWDSALSDFNQAIQLAPREAQAYNNRGLLFSKQQKWDLALSDFNQAIQLAPNDAEAYYNRGILYAQQQKWDLALSDYNRAIQLDSNYAKAYYNRGVVRLQIKDNQEAIEDFQKAAQLFQAQGDMAAYQQMMEVLRQLGG